MFAQSQDGKCTIHNERAEVYLQSTDRIRAIFMDPPDNIGLGYAGYKDNLPPVVYYDWLERLISGSIEKADIVWLSFYHQHLMEIMIRLGKILKYGGVGGWTWRLILWRFTFGQYRADDFTNGYRPILVLQGPGVGLLHENVKVISERMLMGDPRAVGYRSVDDVWEIPRVTGNSKERQPWHPTQHPEELMERIMKLSGYGFCDLFGGTGTTLRVAKKLHMPADVVEIDSSYCERMKAFL